MSELNVYHHELRHNEYAEFYLKSEADAVIANRDYEIKKLKDSISKLLNAKTEQIIDEVMQKAIIYGEGFVRVEDMMKLIVELRHHKFKRCLAMAEMCKERHDIEDMRVNSLCASWDYTESEEMKYWERWQKRWLNLAEKFKEAK